MVTSWVVSGASRGLGLQFVAQILAQEDVQVAALVRSPDKAKGLASLAEKHSNLLVVKADVTNEASIKAAAAKVGDAFGSVDILINNAGILDHFVPALETDVEVYKSVLFTNVCGPFTVSKHFKNFLEAGTRKTIVNISSDAGSISANNKCVRPEDAKPKDPDAFVDDIDATVAGTFIAYFTSKAALNMQTSVIANSLRTGFTVVAIHPGFVKTDMGDGWADQVSDGIRPDLTAEESAAGVLKTINGLTEKNNGQYMDLNGKMGSW